MTGPLPPAMVEATTVATTGTRAETDGIAPATAKAMGFSGAHDGQAGRTDGMEEARRGFRLSEMSESNINGVELMFVYI